MRAGSLSRQCTIWQKQTTVDPVYGTELVSWVPLVAEAGSPTVAVRFWGEKQDALPSRSEAVTQGLVVGRNQVRWRMRWRGDIESSMKVTIHGDSDVDYQIVGGPAEIDGRKSMIELMLERYSS